MTSRWGAPDPGRVMRWYPRAWRHRHSAVLLGTLEEQAETRGGPVLTRADARSMRVHGLAERLSPGVGAGLALAGAVALLFGIVGLVVGMAGAGPLSAVPAVLFVGVGPALLSLSVASLARDVGVTTAAGTVLALVASLVAWVLAALASFSWSSGFRQADLGIERTSFAAASPVFFVGAIVSGAVALAPAFAGVLRGVRGSSTRWTLALVCSVPSAVVIGLFTLAPGSALLPALGLLVAWGLRLRVREGVPDDARTMWIESVATQTDRVGVALDRPRRRLLVALAVVTAVLGAPFSLYAVLGGSDGQGLSWLPAAWEQLPPMNAGLAGGALASLPLVAAGGLAASRRWGRSGGVAGLLVSVAVVMNAVGAAMGPSGDTQTYGVFVAAVLVGIAVLLPAARWVPGPPVGRWAVIVVVGVAAGWSAGVLALSLFPLLAPVVAVVFAVVAARQPLIPRGAAGAHQPRAA